MKIFLLAFLICSLNGFANERKTITDLINRWNDIHNTQNTEEFKELYATTVLFYGKHLPNDKCYQRKSKFLNVAFNQEIISPIRLEYYSSGTIKCLFTKKVTYKKVVKKHDCYLLVEEINGELKISGESDLETDEKLKVELSLGEIVTNEANFFKAPYVLLVSGLAGGAGCLFVYRRRKRKRNQKQKQDEQLPVIHQPRMQHENAPQVSNNDLVAKVKEQVLSEIKIKESAYDDRKQKGDAFEKYVIERFKKEYFTTVEWRSDKFHHGHYAQSSMLPDFEIQFQLHGQKSIFAVECKWRASLVNEQLEWCQRRQMETYRQYSQKKRIPVFIIVGLGGEPSNPEELYIIPLNKTWSHVLKRKTLEQFKRSGFGNFFYNAKAEVLG